MIFFYIFLFIILSGLIFHLLSRFFIVYKLSMLMKKNSKLNNYLNDESDEWLDWLLDNNENAVAAYLYRKKYKVTLSELHKKMDKIKNEIAKK